MQYFQERSDDTAEIMYPDYGTVTYTITNLYNPIDIYIQISFKLH